MRRSDAGAFCQFFPRTRSIASRQGIVGTEIGSRGWRARRAISVLAFSATVALALLIFSHSIPHLAGAKSGLNRRPLGARPADADGNRRSGAELGFLTQFSDDGSDSFFESSRVGVAASDFRHCSGHCSSSPAPTGLRRVAPDGAPEGRDDTGASHGGAFVGVRARARPCGLCDARSTFAFSCVSLSPAFAGGINRALRKAKMAIMAPVRRG